MLLQFENRKAASPLQQKKCPSASMTSSLELSQYGDTPLVIQFKRARINGE